MMDLLLRRRMMMLQQRGGEIPYISNGLIHWFDGINKGGDDGNWHDLVSGVIMTATSQSQSVVNGFSIDSNNYLYSDQQISTPLNSSTIEIVFDHTGSSNLFILYMPNSKNMLAVGFSDAGIIYTSGSDRLPTYNKQISSGQHIISVNTDNCVMDGETLGKSSSGDYWGNVGRTTYLGRRGSGTIYYFTGIIHCVRIYNRILTTEEMLYNQSIDNTRFS